MMRFSKVQRVVGTTGLALLLVLVLCPKWQLKTRWVPVDVGGGKTQPVATIAITWHRWWWNRPPDAAGIAWLYMANEAGIIVGTTVAVMLLSGAWARFRRPAGASSQ
ncbi:MAG: hypothetical protein ACP5VE_15115 [Chthonomonadales bacterium]